jgi:hypothetical protein
VNRQVQRLLTLTPHPADACQKDCENQQRCTPVHRRASGISPLWVRHAQRRHLTGCRLLKHPRRQRVDIAPEAGTESI